MYNLNEDIRKKAIEREIKNAKVREGKKKYMKEYMAERYNNDEEFKERMKKYSRESWKRKHGKSNNLS